MKLLTRRTVPWFGALLSLVEVSGIRAAPEPPPLNHELAPALQLWLRTDALQLDDGEPVWVGPDQGGHGRDVAATSGVRSDGVGLPGDRHPDHAPATSGVLRFYQTFVRLSHPRTFLSPE